MKVRNVLFMAALALAPLRAEAGEDSVEAKFYRGYYLETALRDFDGALAAYDEAEKLATGDAAKFLVPTLVAKARCLQAKGKFDEAKPLLTRVLEIDPSNVEAKRSLELTRAPNAIDPAVEARLDELVRKLGTSEREQATADLKSIGAVKYPFLENGLRSPEVGVVSGCAVLLASDGSTVALAILAEAMRSPDVKFPASLQAGFNYGSGASRFDLVEIAIQSADEELRQAAVNAGIRMTMFDPINTISMDRIAAVVERACQDVSPGVVEPLIYFKSWDPKMVERFANQLVSIVPRLNPEAKRKFASNVVEMRSQNPLLDQWLLSCEKDPDPAVRQSLQLRIARRCTDGTMPVGEMLHHALVALEDPSSNVIEAALRGAEFAAPQFSVGDSNRFFDAAAIALSRWEGTQLDNLDRVLRIAELCQDTGNDRLDRIWKSILPVLPKCSDKLQVQVFKMMNQVARNRLVSPQGIEFVWTCALSIESEAVQLRCVREILPFGLSSKEEQEIQVSKALSSPYRSVRFERYHSEATGMGVRVLNEALLRVVAGDMPEVSAEKARARILEFVASNPNAIFLEPVRRYFEDSAGKLRRTALWTYVLCAGEEAVPLLKKLVEPNSADRDMAYPLLISRLGVDGVDAFIDWYRSSMQKLVTPGGESTGLVLVFIKDQASRREFAKQLMERLPVEEWSLSLMRDLESMCDGVDPRLVEIALGSSDRAVVEHALDLAIAWLPESAEPSIVPYLDSKDSTLARAAQKALSAIRERRELRNVTKLSLSFDKSKAIEESRQLLSSEDPVKRRGGALALGALGDVSAIPLLLKLLDDKLPEVREAALSALSKLDSNPRSTPLSESGERTSK